MGSRCRVGKRNFEGKGWPIDTGSQLNLPHGTKKTRVMKKSKQQKPSCSDGYAVSGVSSRCVAPNQSSFTNHSHHRLSPGLITDSTDFMTGPFCSEHLCFLFLVLFITPLFFCSVRQIKLATRQLLGSPKYSLSYRIIIMAAKCTALIRQLSIERACTH